MHANYGVIMIIIYYIRQLKHLVKVREEIEMETLIAGCKLLHLLHTHPPTRLSQLHPSSYAFILKLKRTPSTQALFALCQY